MTRHTGRRRPAPRPCQGRYREAVTWGTILLLVLLLLLVVWVSAALFVRQHRPDRADAPAAVRLLPSILELTRRVSADAATGRRTRLTLALLRAWIVSPIDLIPDFLPTIGQLDDLIIALVVLRRALRGIDPARRAELWPGQPDGLALFERLLWKEPVAT